LPPRAACYISIPTMAARDGPDKKETTMAWTTPTLVEICIGLEINGYLPAEF
jgi:coenzyme PQQ precursor peptide PqqA